ATSGVVARAVDLGDGKVDLAVARVPLALLGAIGRVRPARAAVEDDFTEDRPRRCRDESDEGRRIRVVHDRNDLIHRVVAHLVGPVDAAGAYGRGKRRSRIGIEHKYAAGKIADPKLLVVDDQNAIGTGRVVVAAETGKTRLSVE